LLRLHKCCQDAGDLAGAARNRERSPCPFMYIVERGIKRGASSVWSGEGDRAVLGLLRVASAVLFRWYWSFSETLLWTVDCNCDGVACSIFVCECWKPCQSQIFVWASRRRDPQWLLIDWIAAADSIVGSHNIRESILEVSWIDWKGVEAMNAFG
jgi:hypothetical protein